MSVLDFLTGVIAPFDCLACGAEGSLLCFTCSQKLPEAPEQFFYAKNLQKVQVATLYQATAKDLLWKLKSGGAQAAAKIIATQMAKRTEISMDSLIVPVPTATSRVRERGYDQAKLLARELAKQAWLPYIDCLARIGQTHQVGASRQQRLQQLKSPFYIKKPRLVKGAHIILVDDVITTGATLEAAAATLKTAGVARVDGIAFAWAMPKI